MNTPCAHINIAHEQVHRCVFGLFQVTGSKNEDQVLNAIEVYTEFRPELAQRAINQLFDIARIQHCSQLLRALQVEGWLCEDGDALVLPLSHMALPFLSPQLVIAALKCHKYDKSIQVTGSAALFYLTNTEYRSDQSVRLRREVIQVVLNGMEQYQEVTVSLCGLGLRNRLNFFSCEALYSDNINHTLFVKHFSYHSNVRQSAFRTHAA